ncbi:PepSY-like domain-containing protein [Capnocytophaga sp.]|uniref:PepSY-like domain-containing protein n=1 Tax=Capnocytophaga sp. TaxID=44737 RepID=UPI0026DCCF79|nr:PepSY-like domain-containing protein [Capnocytophaga sp.]MDO5105445.1 PepSY-like domain-containing protein [Capnocytophaga sp.]
MKKIILNLFLALTAVSFLASCKDKDTPTDASVANVPKVGQEFIKQYFSDLTVLRVEKETGGGHNIHFTNGVEVDFDANGNWTEVSAGDNQKLTNTRFIPEKIRNYLAQMYPNYPIHAIKKNAAGYQVELLNFGGEVTFDRDGNYLIVKD